MIYLVYEYKGDGSEILLIGTTDLEIANNFVEENATKYYGLKIESIIETY